MAGSASAGPAGGMKIFSAVSWLWTWSVTKLWPQASSPPAMSRTTARTRPPAVRMASNVLRRMACSCLEHWAPCPVLCIQTRRRAALRAGSKVPATPAEGPRWWQADGVERRINRLLDAVVAVGGNLDLQAVLHRIAEAAANLVDAEYAALGVISEDGQSLAQFIVVGVDDDMVKRIGELPAGHGVLGKLITDPRPLRLDDLGSSPDSFGFPPNHPPMHTFLGVPIRVRDAVFGNLYLTEKRGGATFDADDEAVVLALAAAAGVAVQNARLYTETRQRERWLAASSEVSTALLSGKDPEEVLSLIACRAREVTDAHLALVALPMDEQRLLVEVAEGEGAQDLRGRLLDQDGSVLGDVLRSSEVRMLVAGEGALALDTGIAVPLGRKD